MYLKIYVAERIGVNDLNELKSHPFFKGIKWDQMRKMKAPFVPEVLIFKEGF